MARIGIVTLGSAPGGGGGLDIYTRGLVEALSDHTSGQNTYVIITTEGAAASWASRVWPAHIHFANVLLQAPARTRTELLRDAMRRGVGLPSLPRHGEEYTAQQIDGLNLNLLHYPSTVIFPFPVRTRCVLTFFDMQHEYYPQFFIEDEHAARARAFRPSVDKAAHLVVPSDYTGRTLRDKYAVPPEKMSLIPVGISDDFRRREAVEVERVRAKYRLPDEFIFYPANPWQHKNHARLMAALRIYWERHGDCPWLVLTGRLRGERREAMSPAIAAGVEDRVIDLAFVEPSDLPTLYSAAALMVFPSLFEGFGIPLVEAMACGCPIAAADATSIPEVTNGAALLFDPLDPQAIADRLHELLHNQEMRAALTTRGLQQIERFDWRKAVVALEAVYAQACGSKRKG